MFVHRAKYVWQYVYQNIQNIKRVSMYGERTHNRSMRLRRFKQFVPRAACCCPCYHRIVSYRIAYTFIHIYIYKYIFNAHSIREQRVYDECVRCIPKAIHQNHFPHSNETFRRRFISHICFSVRRNRLLSSHQCFASPRSLVLNVLGGVPPSSGCLLTCCCWYFS